MKETVWERVERCLDALLDERGVPSGKRVERALENETDEVRREVRALLERLPEPGSVTKGLVDDAPQLLQLLAAEGRSLPAHTPSAVPGQRLGAYCLQREIGRGGMGTVYLAERADDQYEQQVAVKLLSHSAATTEARRRFLRERQILAGLDHPSIARLIDGGVTEDGSPYLVMELVDGLPIDDFCERNGLSLERRLGLFLQVCEAVQAAHAELVAHRDIKPANVLVTDEQRVKLLDFGIAGLSGNSGGEPATVVHAFTPEYASPEQLRLQRAGTASDVYSLGVLLYRLTAGRLPFDLEGLSPGEAERVVCQQEPPAPSAVLANASEAHDREARVRALRRDLDHVVLRAIAKEPERRYGSAAELAADVRRHLEGLPIQARPSTAWYRASRFAARNAVAVAATTAVLLSLVVGLGVALLQANRAARERDLARQESTKAQTVSDFLIEIFDDANPFESAPADARDLLARGEQRIGAALREQSSARADLLGAMSRAYLGLGDREAAERLSGEALELEREQLEEGHPELVQAMLDHAKALNSSGDSNSALELARNALQDLEEHGNSDHDVAIELHRLLASYKGQSDPSAAELHLREALRLEDGRRSGPSVTRALLEHDLALLWGRQGRTEEAMEMRLAALEMLEPLAEPGAPVVFQMQSNLAVHLFRAGRFPEAKPLFEASIEGMESRFGADHPSLIPALTSYGRGLLAEGEFERAAAPIEQAYEIARPLGEIRFTAVAAKINLATLRREQGELEVALQLYEEAMDRLQQQGIDPQSSSIARLESHIGQTLLRMRRWRQAADALERAWQIQSQDPSVSVGNLAETQMLLGSLRCHREPTPERGAGLLDDACAKLIEQLGSDHWRCASCFVERAACRLRGGQRELARSDLEPALEVLRGKLSESSYWPSRAQEIRRELDSPPNGSAVGTRGQIVESAVRR